MICTSCICISLLYSNEFFVHKYVFQLVFYQNWNLFYYGTIYFFYDYIAFPTCHVFSKPAQCVCAVVRRDGNVKNADTVCICTQVGGLTGTEISENLWIPEYLNLLGNS